MVLQLVDGSNTVLVTLGDSTTIASPKFLFVFVNDHTYKKYACAPTETQVDDYRYSFPITLQGSPDPLAGEVYLTLLGFYSVYVYQKTAAQIAAFDYDGIDEMDLRDITGEIWRGKAQLTETASSEAVYKDTRSSEDVYGN